MPVARDGRNLADFGAVFQRRRSRVRASDPAVVAAFVLYLAGMLAIGLWAWRRTRDLADYLLGGRRLGRWVTALSAEASDMSGWLLLGLPGYAYAAGLEAAWIALGLLAGTWLNWRLLAARLREATAAAGDALTLPEFLAARFGGDPLLRVVAAGFILLFFTLYTASGLAAGGKLFESVFGLSYTAAVLAGGAVIVAYTLLGGFFAVSWTDVVQGLLMLVALIAAPLAAVQAQGGWDAAMAAVAARDAALLDPWTRAGGEPLGMVALLSLLAWGLGYFGQPHILARFMAVREAAELVPARRIAMGWVTLTLAGAVLVGLAGIGHLEPPLAGADTEKVFLRLVQVVFHPFVAGALLAAVLAAIMSTADSQLLVAASALTEDFYRAFLRPCAGARELVWMGRATVAAVAVVAAALAQDPASRVLDMVAYAWAGFGATFGPVLLLAVWWPRLSRAGTLAGMLAGGLTVIVWKRLEGGWFDLYELAPGFFAALAAAVLVSLAGRLRRP